MNFSELNLLLEYVELKLSEKENIKSSPSYATSIGSSFVLALSSATLFFLTRFLIDAFTVIPVDQKLSLFALVVIAFFIIDFLRRQYTPKEVTFSKNPKAYKRFYGSECYYLSLMKKDINVLKEHLISKSINSAQNNISL